MRIFEDTIPFLAPSPRESFDPPQRVSSGPFKGSLIRSTQARVFPTRMTFDDIREGRKVFQAEVRILSNPQADPYLCLFLDDWGMPAGMWWPICSSQDLHKLSSQWRLDLSHALDPQDFAKKPLPHLYGVRKGVASLLMDQEKGLISAALMPYDSQAAQALTGCGPDIFPSFEEKPAFAPPTRPLPSR